MSKRMTNKTMTGGTDSTNRRTPTPSKSTKTTAVMGYGRWTDAEHARLMEGIRLFGNDWDKIAQVVQTRSRQQVYQRAYGLRFTMPSGSGSGDGGALDGFQKPRTMLTTATLPTSTSVTMTATNTNKRRTKTPTKNKAKPNTNSSVATFSSIHVDPNEPQPKKQRHQTASWEDQTNHQRRPKEAGTPTTLEMKKIKPVAGTDTHLNNQRKKRASPPMGDDDTKAVRPSKVAKQNFEQHHLSACQVSVDSQEPTAIPTPVVVPSEEEEDEQHQQQQQREIPTTQSPRGEAPAIGHVPPNLHQSSPISSHPTLSVPPPPSSRHGQPNMVASPVHTDHHSWMTEPITTTTTTSIRPSPTHQGLLMEPMGDDIPNEEFTHKIIQRYTTLLWHREDVRLALGGLVGIILALLIRTWFL